MDEFSQKEILPIAPFWKAVVLVAGVWALAIAGFYLIFSIPGFIPSYNAAPVQIALYYFFWVLVSIGYFLGQFRRWLKFESRIWRYLLLSLGFTGVISTLLYFFSQFPVLIGPVLSPYTDILLATPWYFLPKSVEVLLQQVLITTLILELDFKYRSFKKVIIWYAFLFGGAHVILFLLSEAPGTYAAIMTLGALVSSFVFPYLILKVRGGFIYSYATHILFYISLAMILHTLPPSGYYAI